MKFELDNRLENDSAFVCELQLCQVRLILDSNYPWYLLIPQRESVVEVTDLCAGDYDLLWKESKILSNAIQSMHSPDKLNVAALGNIVSQLHVHHIARFTTDPAWPNPVWGSVPARQYTQDDLRDSINKIKTYLKKE